MSFPSLVKDINFKVGQIVFLRGTFELLRIKKKKTEHSITRTGRSQDFDCVQVRIEFLDDIHCLVKPVVGYHTEIILFVPHTSLHKTILDCKITKFIENFDRPGFKSIVACELVFKKITDGFANSCDFMQRINQFFSQFVPTITRGANVGIFDYENMRGRAKTRNKIIPETSHLPLQTLDDENLPYYRAPLVSILRDSMIQHRTSIIIVCKMTESEELIKIQLRDIKNHGSIRMLDIQPDPVLGRKSDAFRPREYKINCMDIQKYTTDTPLILVRVKSLCNLLCPLNSSFSPPNTSFVDAIATGHSGAVGALRSLSKPPEMACVGTACSFASGESPFASSLTHSWNDSSSEWLKTRAMVDFGSVTEPTCLDFRSFACPSLEVKNEEEQKIRDAISVLSSRRQEATHDLRGCDDAMLLIIYTLLKEKNISRAKIHTSDENVFSHFKNHHNDVIPFDIKMTVFSQTIPVSVSIPINLFDMNTGRIQNPELQSDVVLPDDEWVRRSFFTPSVKSRHGADIEVNNWWKLPTDPSDPLVPLVMVLNVKERPIGIVQRLEYVHMSAEGRIVPTLNFDGQPYCDEKGNILKLDGTNIPYVSLGRDGLTYVPAMKSDLTYFKFEDESFLTINVHDYQPHFKKYLKYKEKYLLLKQKLGIYKN